MEPVTLRTPRLILRAPVPGDIDALTAACQDPEIPRWTTVPSPYTSEDAAQFVRLCEQSWEDGSQAAWTIIADDTLVGAIGLHRITPHPAGGDAEIGYWTAAPARGRGYLSEAAHVVLDWGFTDLGLIRIGWRAVVGNVPSARSARALGFRYEGMSRQALPGPRGRDDGWVAGLLRDDDRSPVPWPVDLGGDDPL
ncbi:MAG: GNAT family N-acetyltransferase [Actinobacteria bacterium]|nr:GNAT family N-acetyltransferase [Actinomycetota bacterium]